ncbi:Polynucleotidyl transferase ribonuclease H-like superfamily protein [Euphorbia peplus]|nr:Polynucleotidyl transferase ribonuclease H-like superfamily protein [Euphorbia peplus]
MSQYINFGGQLIETTVTARAGEVDNWISSINRSRSYYDEIIVGLDCEWRPNVQRGVTNITATLQLCVGTKCLIIQLFYMEYIPQSLHNFMRNRSNIFVGVEVDRDVAKLRGDYELDCAHTADVRDLAISYWPNLFSNPRPGLKEIAFRVLGLSMVKPPEVCRSDWQKRELTAAQVEYATIDAYASFSLGYRLIKET